MCLRRKIKALGHIIEENGRVPDPAKSSAIKDMPTPKNIKNWLTITMYL